MVSRNWYVRNGKSRIDYVLGEEDTLDSYLLFTGDRDLEQPFPMISKWAEFSYYFTYTKTISAGSMKGPKGGPGIKKSNM